jgi:hypothetical protein
MGFDRSSDFLLPPALAMSVPQNLAN